MTRSTNPERKVLAAVYRLTEEWGEPPTFRQLVDEPSPRLTDEEVATLVQRLLERGYLSRRTDRLILTERAVEYFRRLTSAAQEIMPRSPRPMEIQVVGYVQAGQVEEITYGEETDQQILVPNLGLNKRAFAYQVHGHSMEQASGIYQGDYVIVEDMEGEWPRENELIVTRYAADESGMVGPVLKYFAELDEDGQKVYRLSWRKPNDQRLQPGYEIRAWRIEPIGRVIGIYRPVAPSP